MKNQSYKKKIDREWFKERDRVSKLFDKIDFHKIVYVFLFVFIVSSCSKKQLITGGTGAGVGLGSYAIFKSFMGQSGTGGDMKTMIAITTIGTVMGALMGSEIADNIIEEDNNYSQRIMNSAFEDDLRQVWRGQNQNILIEPQEPINVPNLSNSECRKFEFTFEEMGTIKRGSGIACKDGNKNWRMLGEEML